MHIHPYISVFTRLALTLKTTETTVAPNAMFSRVNPLSLVYSNQRYKDGANDGQTSASSLALKDAVFVEIDAIIQPERVPQPVHLFRNHNRVIVVVPETHDN